MEATEAIINKLLKGIEAPAMQETSHDEMNLNWKRVQTSLKGWLNRTFLKGTQLS